MSQELVHSLDSVSLLVPQLDTYSPLMLLVMQVGKLPHLLDGDSLEMLEQIHSLNLLEQLMLRILYSRRIIQRSFESHHQLRHREFSLLSLEGIWL
jgi:hypothetical protein